MVWHTDAIKCLGVWIGSSPRVCARNWRNATDKLDCVLQRWSGRDLFCLSGDRSEGFCCGKTLECDSRRTTTVPPGVVADIVRKGWSFMWHNMRTLVRRPLCTVFTTVGRLGALDFDFKVASLHIQWMRRLPLGEPSKWLLFAKLWLERVASPFGWQEFLAGLNVPVSGIPIFYGTILKQYYRLDAVCPRVPRNETKPMLSSCGEMRRLPIARVSLCEWES